MFDAKALLEQVLGVAEKYAGKENIDKLKEKAAANPGMAKAGAVGAAAVLLGTRTGRGVLKLGALAGVGGLAYKAYQDWQSKQQGEVMPASNKELAPPPSGSGFETVNDEQEKSLAILTAMIAAAKSDGEIDRHEQERIFGKINELNSDREARAFLMDEMMSPLDIDKIAALASSKEQAVQIYTASVLAIKIDTPAERGYLDELGKKLGLEPGLTQSIESAVAAESAAV